jgi:hypothetical protein
MIDLLELAASYALPNDENDARNFLVGAAGKRKDSTIVRAQNGAVFSTEVDRYFPIPEAHAEVRLLRKLGAEGVMAVARISKKSGGWTLSRPCPVCQIYLRSKRTQKVAYTIDGSSYGVLYPMTGEEKTFRI